MLIISICAPCLRMAAKHLLALGKVILNPGQAPPSRKQKEQCLSYPFQLPLILIKQQQLMHSLTRRWYRTRCHHRQQRWWNLLKKTMKFQFLPPKWRKPRVATEILLTAMQLPRRAGLWRSWQIRIHQPELTRSSAMDKNCRIQGKHQNHS